VAGTLVAMALIDRVYHVLAPHAPVLLWHFALDAMAAIALLAIGLFANRIYTLWIGSLQILALSAHLVSYFTREAGLTLPFTIMYILPSYFQIALLLWGTHLHARRVRRFGQYRSWKSYSRPSSARERPSWQER